MRGSSYPETLVQMEGRTSLPTQGQVRSLPKELSIAPPHVLRAFFPPLLSGICNPDNASVRCCSG